MHVLPFFRSEVQRAVCMSLYPSLVISITLQAFAFSIQEDYARRYLSAGNTGRVEVRVVRRCVPGFTLFYPRYVSAVTFSSVSY
jgi:hypothetical protein